MKILHVISSIWKNGGGTSEVVPRLCLAQKEVGHDVTLAVGHYGEISDIGKKASDKGVNFIAFKRDKFLSKFGLSSEMKNSIGQFVGNSDIIHLHGLWQAPCWYAGKECQKQKKPYVMMPHGFLEPERLKISRWKKWIIGQCIEKPLLKAANGIIATSESEENGIRAYGLTNRVHIMPIGLDLGDIDCGEKNNELLKKIGCDLNKKHLLYFSRITPIKGLDMLAEAWSRVDHTGWQLVIVGPDDRGYACEVKKMYAEQIVNGAVVMNGAIYGKDKYDLLKSVDAFVLPTRSENWSIAIAEAMAAKLPVLCTKGAPWKCIDDVNAGCWVDITPRGIELGLQKIFTMNDCERIESGTNGRKWVEDNLQWHKIAEELIHFYSQII